MTKPANDSSATRRPMFAAWGHHVCRRRHLVLVIAGLDPLSADVNRLNR